MQTKFILGLLILVVIPQLSSAEACLVEKTALLGGSAKLNYCVLCKNNYSLLNGGCIYKPGYSCNVNYCMECEIGNANRCQVCQPYYKQVFLSGRCTPEICYDSNCFSCKNDRYYCDVCKLNYWSDLYGNCLQKCDPEACSNCTQDIKEGESRCTECTKNKAYVLQCKLYNKI